MGTSSLDYRKPTYQILASYHPRNPLKSFRWWVVVVVVVVLVLKVTLVFSFGPNLKLWFWPRPKLNNSL